MAAPAIRSEQQLVDYTASLDCIHCGLCLSTCPTYRLTGAESSSPRGRIHLMRAVAEGSLEADAEFRDEMDFCLVCRHCESVCPAGIHMGSMMSFTRDALVRDAPPSRLERFGRWLGFRVLLPRRTALRIAGSLLRLGQRSGLLSVLAHRSPVLRQELAALAALPDVAPANGRRLLPAVSPATGPRPGSGPASVSVLEGCVMPELYPGVNRATVRVLTRLGLEVRSTREAVCCGALHAHNGDLEGARTLARRTIAAYETLGARAGDERAPVVVNSAGCGAHLKELAHLFEESDPWHARAQALSARVVDLAEFVAPLVAEAAPALRAELAGPVTWDNPCHLCHGQGIRDQPVDLLDRIELPGGGRVELQDAESCCGSAGIYSALRPDDSAAILEPKLDALEASGARVLVTANPGCQLQWQSGIRRRGLAVEVRHLAEVLDRALRDPREG